jgi:UDP-2-acetamido-2-deoxy-ribo-hexuluronate aminotransferase
VAAAVTSRSKAILAVNLYGQCADYRALREIGLPIIEDAAQSFGATYYGQPSCGLAHISCTSFFPSKPLGCYGDGGACFTSDDVLAQQLRQLRTHGQIKRYQHQRIGMNSRLDTLQAAILLEKLKHFPKEVIARQKIAEQYNKLFTTHGLVDKIQIPVIAKGNTSVYAQYTVALNKRDEVQKRLQHALIATAVHYPAPLHLQPAFTYLGYTTGCFPHAEHAAQHVLSLPMHPYLNTATQLQIVTTLKTAVSA